jgi:hypothetical protein
MFVSTHCTYASGGGFLFSMEIITEEPQLAISFKVENFQQALIPIIMFPCRSLSSQIIYRAKM